MPEPTTSGAHAVALAISAMSMALLGVDYYALLWALVGALLALFQAEKMGRTRSVIFITLSTLVGAACGTGALEFASNSRPLLIVSCLIGGFGAQLIVSALLRAGLKRIDKLGGE